MFSPIWNSGPSPYASLIEALVRHGYVVAAIHHPLDEAQEAADLSSPAKIREKNLEVMRRANDARFLLDQLEKVNQKDPSGLASRGLILHRFGSC